MKDFRDLLIWEKSHIFGLNIYKETRLFPKTENFGITSQIRRASISIPTNIAEGCGRSTDLDFARFLQVAMGSASESEYLLFLSYELQYLNEESFQQLNQEIESIKRMLTSLIKRLRADR